MFNLKFMFILNFDTKFSYRQNREVEICKDPFIFMLPVRTCYRNSVIKKLKSSKIIFWGGENLDN
jgi:hypothetical protein